ncbi:NAD(P)-binding domain-containing protein [Pseudonocardia charpentierae]|uniref:NAD(P)-binding domain-containing protein n=1 Tax=Pseudonocardia charpentierae TaxID=3075545 RepID=A0ABU2NKF9_9PSEU|nr:NAD(P)-binding domain-containing protein [Pseudonocardia sp. DSM 45834]MDT0353699.1 NAD(P)-binding domain-containing protein [Pseudonocardia sp. DSM 45834]
MSEQHDTVIIGGGQAGLAMSSVLRRHGLEHVVLERRRIGERWRTERWDSLRFQFPNWTVQLPERRYAGDDPDGFAHYGEILRFLEDYAASTRAPVREHTEVFALHEADDTGFVLSTTDSVLHARRVVVATGPFQRPLIPQPAHHIPPSVLQTDPTRYRCPAELPDGAVLVVGSGASGCQIADELLHAGRRVYLSVSQHRRAPRRFRGRDVYWWLEKLGRFAQTIDSFPDRRWPPSTVITGVNGGYNVNVRQLAADGIAVIGRVAGASRGTVAIHPNANQILDDADTAYDTFLSAARQLAATEIGHELADEQPMEAPRLPATVEEVDSLDLTRTNIRAIIWATGYTYDFGWIKLPVFDQRGRPAQHRGVTQRPGLYFLGLHWMHTFQSGLLAGVGNDAEYLADHMSASSGRCPATGGG